MVYNRVQDKLRDERLKRQGLFNQYHRRLRNIPPWIKAPPNHHCPPLPPILSNNRHGYRKRPLTPPLVVGSSTIHRYLTHWIGTDQYCSVIVPIPC